MLKMQTFDTMLTDHCWQHVFRFLSLEDRVKAEKVSKRWKKIMPYLDISSIRLGDHISSDDVPTYSFYKASFHWMVPVKVSKTAILQERILNSLFKRLGKGLKSIDFDLSTAAGKQFLVTKQFLLSLSKTARNLIELKFINCTVALDALPLLATTKHFPYLNSLNLSGFNLIERSNLTGGRFCKDYHYLEVCIAEVVQAHRLWSIQISDIEHSFNFREISKTMRNLNMDLCFPLSYSDLEFICANFPNLESVSLQSCYGLEKFCPALLTLKSLKHLNLSGTKLSNYDLLALSGSCRLLESIKINNCRSITNFVPLSLLPNLHSLSVGPSVNMVDSVLERIVAGKSLRSLKAEKCMELTDRAMRALAKYCPQLEELLLTESLVTNNGFTLVMEACKKLQILDLSACSQVNNCTMILIGSNCRALRQLTADNCRFVDDIGYWNLVERRKKYLECGIVLPWVSVSHYKPNRKNALYGHSTDDQNALVQSLIDAQIFLKK